MPNYSNQEPTDEIKSLIEQLSQACESLQDEELKNKLLPLIDQLKQILPLESNPDQGMNDAEDMMKNKQAEGGVMDSIMGNVTPEKLTP